MEGKLTSASGNMFSMPAYEAETSAFNILVGSNLALNEHINLDLNLSVITGDASSEYIINLGTWGKL
ncbi:MAG: hypothetical protein ACD_79C00338G0003 [uncultured bacterium]|nr:MAG: hypothetical protein ACD_79C00338G0003 [uncultured bacterium]